MYFQRYRNGTISDDTVIEVKRFNLLVADIGGTNVKTKKILKKAEGLDEAYILSLTSGKDYGKEAVVAMMAKMNVNIDEKKIFFIFAGHPSEVEDFLRVNPALSRRTPRFLQFNDYTPMELVDITNEKAYVVSC